MYTTLPAEVQPIAREDGVLTALAQGLVWVWEGMLASLVVEWEAEAIGEVAKSIMAKARKRRRGEEEEEREEDMGKKV